MHRVSSDLKKERDHYAALYDFAPINFFLIDEAHRIHEANQTLTQLLGTAPETIHGAYLCKFAIAADCKKCSDFIHRAITSQTPQTFEIRIQQPGGTLLTALLEIVPTQERHKYAWICYGTLTDISDRKQAEKLHQDHAEQLILALETGGMGMWDWHIAEDKTVFDLRFYQLCGYQEDGGFSLETFFDHIHEADRSKVRSDLETVLSSGADFTDEFRLLHQDGSTRWFSTHGRLTRSHDDKPEHMIGITYDITYHKETEDQLRQNEDRLRIAAAAANLGAYYRNLKTGENYWSPEFMAIYGLAPHDDLWQEKDIPSCVHPNDREKVLSKARARLSRQRSAEFSSEHRTIRPDGMARWVLLRGEVTFAPLQSIIRECVQQKERQN